MPRRAFQAALTLTLLVTGLLVAPSLLAQTPVAATGDEAAATQLTVTAVGLRHRARRSWDVVLPRERFKPIGKMIPLPHSEGEGFAVALEGTALRIDSDADGVLDLKIEGDSGFAVLKARRSDGSKLRHAIRLRQAGEGWTFGPGGLMQGRLGDTKLRLIDQNLNGRYDDFGKDAMIVGDGRAAAFLSRAINVDGKLLAIDVAADGRRLTARAFDGEAGVLDLRGGFDSKARLLEAVVTSVDGRYSFDLAEAPEGLRVPAVRYQIHSGSLGFGEARLAFRTGRSRSVAVPAGAKKTVNWGDGPVAAEFDYARDGGKIGFRPDEVWYYGAAGEEYLGWSPIGQSPKFTISERGSGREVAVAYFPGRC